MDAKGGTRGGRPGSDTARRRAADDLEAVLRTALGQPPGTVEAYTTPFGIIAWAPDTNSQRTVLWLAGDEPRRVHGALKRVLLTLAKGRYQETRRADAAEARLASALAGGRN